MTGRNTNPYAVYWDEQNRVFTWGKSPELGVLFENNQFSWVSQSVSSNIPEPKNVKNKVKYGPNLEGTLGKINENDLDITKQIRENAIDIISSYINYKKLAYMNNLDLNNKTQNQRAYGVQVKGLTEGEGTTVREMVRTLTIVLRMVYTPKGLNDNSREEVADELRTKMEQIQRIFDETNAGSFDSVMGVNNFSQPDIEFNEDGDSVNIATCFMDVDVIYPVNNK